MPTKTERPRSRVFLVDDHSLVREHLTALIEAESDLEVCGEAADAPSALILISRQCPDLVILDISLKHSSGLDLLKDLKTLYPKLSVLVLSMHEEKLYAERALRAGAMGYITKVEATVNILSAIRLVLSGKIFLSDQMAWRVAGSLVTAGHSITEEVRV